MTSETARTLLASRLYQLSSATTESNATDEQNFSHAIPRRVPAEALLDSLIQATGVPENFGGAPAGFEPGAEAVFVRGAADGAAGEAPAGVRPSEPTAAACAGVSCRI